jgi:hypothetical protein
MEELLYHVPAHTDSLASSARLLWQQARSQVWLEQVAHKDAAFCWVAKVERIQTIDYKPWM